MVKNKTFTIRLNSDIVDKIDLEAKEQRRSRNAQIETILEDRYKQEIIFKNTITNKEVDINEEPNIPKQISARDC